LTIVFFLLGGDPSKPQSTGASGLPLSTGLPTNRLTFFQLVDAALDRRPYLSESEGFILLRTDAALKGHRLVVKAELHAANKSWGWDNVEGGGEVSLPFNLTTLPLKTIHNDILITISDPEEPSLKQGVTIQRRFHRIPTVPNPTVEPVQIDHARKGLLINGKPWVGTGWYVSYLVDVGWNMTTESQLEKLADLIRYDFAPRGINQLMFYALFRFDFEAQLRLLDVCHSVGIKVMYEMAESLGQVHIDQGGPFNNPELLKPLIANVTLVRDHPAIMGYYICDDCCQSFEMTSLQSQVYQLIKDLDPYHVTIGAVNCGDGWQFTDAAPSFLASESNLLTEKLPEAKQPALQLSLDVVMHENYDTSLVNHAGGDSWETGIGQDGFYRNGMGFSPVINCPGSYAAWPAPRLVLSAMWLGVLTAGMYSTLNFVYDNNAHVTWLKSDQSAIFSKQISTVAPAVTAPFGQQHRHPVVSVVAPNGTGAAVARGWSVPGQNCSFLIVTNLDEAATHQVEIKIVSRIDGVSYAGQTATRMFEAVYPVNVSASGLMQDYVDAGNTNAYSIGDCGTATAPGADKGEGA